MRNSSNDVMIKSKQKSSDSTKLSVVKPLTLISLTLSFSLSLSLSLSRSLALSFVAIYSVHQITCTYFTRKLGYFFSISLKLKRLLQHLFLSYSHVFRNFYCTKQKFLVDEKFLVTYRRFLLDNRVIHMRNVRPCT